MFRLSQVFRHGSILNNYVKNACRTLYSVNSLGVEGFVDKREKVKQYFHNNAEKFREKMTDFIENDQTSMIFTEDLKNMIHLADPNEKDLQLLEQMLRKFNKQSTEMRFGNFIFGPIVMRLFYHINNSDIASRLFKDPDFGCFFNQLISYQILVDMLYEVGRFKDVIDVFQSIRTRQIKGSMYPRHVVLLVFAACYKENTPESFKFSSELWSEMIGAGVFPMRRAITFAAALAIRQNAPHVALEIVGTARQQQYVTVRNIKVLAFTELGRTDDALPILKSVLQMNDTVTKHSFTKDVIDKLKEAVNNSGNNELVQNYNRIEKFLSENCQIVDKTLEDLLTTEISTLPQNEFRKDKSVLAASYNSNYNRHDGNQNYDRRERNQNYEYGKSKYRARQSRPGLEDLY